MLGFQNIKLVFTVISFRVEGEHSLFIDCVFPSVYYLQSAVEEAAVLSWLVAEPFAGSDGGHGAWSKDALQPTAA